MSDSTGKQPRLADTWSVYILRCSDNTLYTGITRDSERRLREHNGELSNGARYTRARRPVTLVYLEAARNRQDASKREFVLKSLKKDEKEALVASQTPVLE